MAIIFQSTNLLIEHIIHCRSKIVLVTFTERDLRNLGLDRPGFAQDFARKFPLDGIFVKCIGNDWYQYPEMVDALGAINAAVPTECNVVTYGSSMGAYAALRFAKPLNAVRAIAISPQISIDPVKVPFERRWQIDSARVTFIDDDLNDTDARGRDDFILSDPFNMDGLHARMLKCIRPSATLLKVPFAHHPAGHFLREADLLKDLITSLILGEFKETAWAKNRRRNRSLSSIYMRSVEKYLQKRGATECLRSE